MRYGTYIAKYKIRHSTISYNQLTPKPDADGEKSLRPERIKVTPRYAFALLRPYCGSRFMEQLRAVLTLAVYLALFQVFVLQYPIQAATTLFIGLFDLIVCLAYFILERKSLDVQIKGGFHRNYNRIFTNW